MAASVWEGWAGFPHGGWLRSRCTVSGPTGSNFATLFPSLGSIRLLPAIAPSDNFIGTPAEHPWRRAAPVQLSRSNPISVHARCVHSEALRSPSGSLLRPSRISSGRRYVWIPLWNPALLFADQKKWHPAPSRTALASLTRFWSLAARTPACLPRSTFSTCATAKPPVSSPTPQPRARRFPLRLQW